MLPKKLYLLILDGQILETFTSLPVLWDYLISEQLKGDFTYPDLERELDRSERFEFNWNGQLCVVKLDYPNRALAVLQWMGIE